MNYYTCDESCLVKWQDEAGGWHTGKVMLTHDLTPVSDMDHEGQFLTLVKESCDGRMTWVSNKIMIEWKPRSEWEYAEEKKEEAIRRIEEQTAG